MRRLVQMKRRILVVRTKLGLTPEPGPLSSSSVDLVVGDSGPNVSVYDTLPAAIWTARDISVIVEGPAALGTLRRDTRLEVFPCWLGKVVLPDRRLNP